MAVKLFAQLDVLNAEAAGLIFVGILKARIRCGGSGEPVNHSAADFLHFGT